jgi:hypothetical protein
MFRFATKQLGLIVILSLAASTACGELQNVLVGGEIHLRGNWWAGSFNSGSAPALVRNEIRYPATALQGRPVGRLLGNGAIVSHFDWDKHGNDYSVIEQRTRLGVRGDFTENVSAFIELDSFNIWGEDFRSDYITGVDRRGTSSVDLFQAYIEANELFGFGLRARVGRQELVFGNGWLVGNNAALPEATGLSFDGIRLTYTRDMLTIDAFLTKLRETSPLEADGDTDFAGLYASYKPIDELTVDAYWFWLRDAASVTDTNYALFDEWLEDALGLDNYGVTNLHTVGARVAGALEGFDFDAQAAYQFGNASQVGRLFNAYTYGDDHADFDNWAADLELGYTFDFSCAPRIFLGATYFGGQDNRDLSFWRWLNPFAELCRPQSSISFNRLFSNRVYSYFFDEMGELSNAWTARAGLSAHPLENLETGIEAAYFATLETFDQPVHVWIGRYRIPLIPELSFWTSKSPSELGWQTTLWVKYNYSEDLSFAAGWSHLFTADGLKEGNYSDLNGLLFNGGTDNNDADYFYIETKLKF